MQSLAMLNPLLHYVYCGAPLIRTICGGQVLDVVWLRLFLSLVFSIPGCNCGKPQDMPCSSQRISFSATHCWHIDLRCCTASGQTHQPTQHISRTGYEPCQAAALCASPASALQGLLPDGLHPNAAGMDLIAECLEESLAPLLGNSQNYSFPRTATTRQYDSRVAELPC